MDALIQDIRYGIRQLFRQSGSSAVAVLTLALGIGVTTALFSVIDAAMLRPLPYPEPERLVIVRAEGIEPGGEVFAPNPSMEDMRTWQTATDVFSLVAANNAGARSRIVDGPEPERIEVQQFTEDYLSMHGVTPLLGRDFSRADTEPGAPIVGLLGYGYWQSRYGGRDDVLGTTIRLDADVVTVVGVLPAWFDRTTPLATAQQVPVNEFSRRGTGRVEVFARLQPGVTIAQASERLTPRTPRRPWPDGTARDTRTVVESRLEEATSRSRTTVNVLVGAVGLILMISIVNVAGLLLARGSARQTELAVRAAIGAGRRRLVRQLLTESVVLAVPAAAIGAVLAWFSLDVVVANLPLSLPTNSPVRVSPTVLLLTATLLVPATLLFGMVPALRLSRVQIGIVLARGGRQGGPSLSRRGGQVLIAAEVALAVILVAGAGLMIRSLIRIASVDLGFNAAGLLTMQVLPLERNPDAHKAYHSALLQRLKTVHGVDSVGLVDNFALRTSTRSTSLVVDGKSSVASVFQVLPGYFETIGASLRQGRLPTDADYASGFSGVVISESAAQALFPEGAPIGRQLIRQPGRPWTVIGVIADLRHRGPLVTPRPRQVFFPLEPTRSDLTTAMTFVIRPTGATAGLADRLRQAAQAIGPRVLVEEIRTADDLFGDLVITPRQRAVLLGLLGALGLTMALVGVFGMTAYAVTRRTSEIGVRIAFGARPDQVVRTILRDSAIPVLTGAVLGVAGAALAARVIESFLFQTAPTDPATLAIVAVTLSIAGCLAALVPALRAARVPPTLSLRAQ